MSILSVALGLIRALPYRLAVAAGRSLVLTYLALTPGVRREISRNYRLVVGPEPAGFWCRNGWRLGEILAVMVQTGRRSMQKLLDKSVVTGQNVLERIMLANRRTVAIGLHYGAWELLPQVLSRRNYRVCVGTGAQSDRTLDGRLARLRQTPGVTFTSSIDRMRESLRDGAIVGYVLDNTTRTRRVACDTLAPGFRLLRTPFTLAAAEDGVLVPMFARPSRNRLEVVIQEPVASPEEFGERSREQIRSHPEDWVFWGKNRATTGA